MKSLHDYRGEERKAWRERCSALNAACRATGDGRVAAYELYVRRHRRWDELRNALNSELAKRREAGLFRVVRPARTRTDPAAHVSQRTRNGKVRTERGNDGADVAVVGAR